MSNRKGLSAALVDFIVIGVFILFIILMLFFFSMVHKSIEKRMGMALREGSAIITLHNLLRTEVKGTGQTLAELLVNYSITEEPELQQQIQEFFEQIKNTTGIYQVTFAYGGKLIVDSGRDYKNCEPYEAYSFLPSMGYPFARPSVRLGLITLRIAYCQND